MKVSFRSGVNGCGFVNGCGYVTWRTNQTLGMFINPIMFVLIMRLVLIIPTHYIEQTKRVY